MYEVVLEDHDKQLSGWFGEAESEEHAVELAKDAHPDMNVVGAMEMKI